MRSLGQNPTEVRVAKRTDFRRSWIVHSRVAERRLMRGEVM